MYASRFFGVDVWRSKLRSLKSTLSLAGILAARRPGRAVSLGPAGATQRRDVVVESETSEREGERPAVATGCCGQIACGFPGATKR